MTDFLCEYTISGKCAAVPKQCTTECAYHAVSDDGAKIAAAQRLVAQVNEAEQVDPELSWNPWVVRRRHDPRGG